MKAGPRVAALAIVLFLSVPATVAADYRAEILEQVIRPCFEQLARRHGGEGVTPEAAAEAMIARYSKDLAALVESINGQLESDPPAVARRQIYRVALRTCIRRVWRAEVSAQCLTLERHRIGDTGNWINACGHGVTVRWTTETGRTGIRWVGAGDVIWARFGPPDEEVSWRECRSDTPYASRPVERNGRWDCRSR